MNCSGIGTYKHMLTDRLSEPAGSASSLHIPVISHSIKHPAWTECQITLPACDTDCIRWGHLGPFLNASGESILNADFFVQNACIASLSSERQIKGIAEVGTTLLVSSGVGGGVQIGTLSGVDSTPLYDGERVIGRFFEDDDAKYCWLGGILPAEPAEPRPAQTGQVLHSIQKVLEQVGMHFRDVIRTWFYNDHILDWYDDFNRVRTAFFRQHGITRIPASTGIGISNAAGTALVAKAFAVQPKTGQVAVRRIQSPLQCEASEYGSSFSRAMEVRDSSTRTLYVSGTASIEPAGQTIHAGNAARQIETTMEVVSALMEEAGMVLSDTTRAIAYFRRAEDVAFWHEYCRNKQLPPLPIILVPSDVCRDDLLFEIELDAACAS